MITQMFIGTSQQVNSPKYLIGAYQTSTRADTAAKKIMSLFLIILIFGNILLR